MVSTRGYEQERTTFSPYDFRGLLPKKAALGDINLEILIDDMYLLHAKHCGITCAFKKAVHVLYLLIMSSKCLPCKNTVLGP